MSSHTFALHRVLQAQPERVRYTDRFDDPNLPGLMTVTVTVTIEKGVCGTELRITQEGGGRACGDRGQAV